MTSHEHHCLPSDYSNSQMEKHIVSRAISQLKFELFQAPETEELNEFTNPETRQ